MHTRRPLYLRHRCPPEIISHAVWLYHTGIEQFEADLWKVADNLRANSNLASNEYFMPILGLIFLRHATNRYYAALDLAP